MQLKKFNKSNYKIGTVLAIRGAVGFIVGFDSRATYSNVFYVYTVLPLNFITTKTTDIGLDNNEVLRETEGAIKEALKDALKKPMNEKRVLKCKTTTSKMYLGEKLNTEDILLWRTKSMFTMKNTMTFDDDMGCNITPGRVYMTANNGTKYLALTSTRFVLLRDLDDWKSGKYDDVLKRAKYSRGSSYIFTTLSDLTAYGLNPTNETEDISWYEEKWENL